MRLMPLSQEMLKDEVRTKSYRSSIYGSKHLFKVICFLLLKASPKLNSYHRAKLCSMSAAALVFCLCLQLMLVQSRSLACVLAFLCEASHMTD